MRISSKSTLILRLVVCALGMSLLAVAYSRFQTVPAMAAAANNFLAALYPEQKEKATFKVEDDERMNWFYTPVPRKGLPLREMTSGQRQLAFALLSSCLSHQGFVKSTTIMSLDEVLLKQEPDGPRRDPEGYFFSIFGTPSETGTWAVRIEGHHLSQNFTIVNGKVQGAPSFFGDNPAQVLQGTRKGLRALAKEEDLGRDVIQSLTPDQQKIAVVDPKAPGDILTEHSREAALKGQANGIQVSAMTAPQKEKLQALLEEYCDNMTEEVSALRKDQIRKAGNDLWFAWAGGTQKGELHYYRIQSPAFLVEFDDTQNGGNHIHSVWRDLKGDFGRDMLAEHYQNSHK